MSYHLKTVVLKSAALALGWLALAPAIFAFSVVEASIADIHDAYRDGRVSVHEVTAAYLARIAAYDKKGPYINSLITINPQALAVADQMDAEFKATGKMPGLLWGIPVVLKDNLDTKDMATTAGFQGWKNFHPSDDAFIAAKIRDAGAVILAKASLSEFAKGGGDNINSVLPGFARNPYNTAYATGGSSGGTGASLASSFAVVGIGTDTGGSVRMPSAHNALVGLRPTVGLVSREGLVPLDGVRDTPGPMARSVTDMAILLSVIAGADPNDAATARNAGHVSPDYTQFLHRDGLKGVRLGVLRQVFRPAKTDPRIIANFEKTIAELKAAGATIVDPFVVPELDTIPNPPQTASQFKHDLAIYIAKHPGIPYPSVQEISDTHMVHPLHQQSFEQAVTALPIDKDPATLKGRIDEERYRVAFMKAMNAAGVDALVFPTWAQLPAINGDRNTQITDDPQPLPNAGPTHLGASLTFVGSMLQWPALSVPNGYIEGLPLGLQILGRAWDEGKIIQCAFAYEQATHYRLPPPTVPPLSPHS